jgi:hypothetical protein
MAIVLQPAIEAATGEAADALQRGKIANKVLKNLGSVMVASIKVRDDLGPLSKFNC